MLNMKKNEDLLSNAKLCADLRRGYCFIENIGSEHEELYFTSHIYLFLNINALLHFYTIYFLSCIIGIRQWVTSISLMSLFSHSK